MTNENKNPETTTYTATFTLSQTGDGPVSSSLTFNPLDGENVDLNALAPAAFQIMSELVAHYLYVTGIIDRNGELIDPQNFAEMSTVSAH